MNYIQIWLHNGDGFKVHDSYNGLLDATVTQWKHETRDSLLSLETVPGEPVTIAASDVMWWHTSTPESRAQSIHLEVALEDEHKANLTAAGRWEDS